MLALAGCTSVRQTTTPAKTISLSGRIQGGQQPVTDSTIQLYAVGTSGDGSPSTPLLTTTVTTSDGSGNATNSNANAGNVLNTLPAGNFTITGDYTCPVANPSADVYLVATGGNPGLAAGTNNPALAMMAALGPCNGLTPSTTVFVNELTTVGSLAALNYYMTSYAAMGSGTSDAPQLQQAFSNVNYYTNTTNGTVPGPALPASTYAWSIEINTLADALVSCMNSNGSTAGSNPCALLFQAATPPGGSQPSDTIQAAINVLHFPTANVCGIYGLALPTAAFQPLLANCPASWSLPIASIGVSVSGASSIYAGQTTQYTATVSSAPNNPQEQAVTWSVNGIAGGNASVGTIDANGNYTAPNTPPGSAVTITATSVLSSTAYGQASVTVQPVTVAVTGPNSLAVSGTGQYAATVTGSGTQTVTWSVNGVAGGNSTVGTISASGFYTAPAAAPAATVTISAASTAFPSSSGSQVVTIAAQAVVFATGDSRTVTQPVVPAVCQTVNAQFTTSQRSTPPAAASDDTTRLQAALTACKNTGQAVELAVSGGNNAFFASSTLTVTGETLLIDSGATLYGNDGYVNSSYLVKLTGTNVGLMGPGTIDGRGDILGTVPQQYTTRLVQGSSVTNLNVYNVTLTQSIYPNLYVETGSGVTIWGVTIRTPATRANADGIDIDSLTNVTVTNSSIEAGDDGVAVKTNSAAASNITVSNNYFYGTHGISIGSQTFKGVTNVLFSNNTLDGTDLLGNASGNANGVNIKTDPTCGGLVQQVTYQNTCLKRVKHLIILNTQYGTCSGTAGTPQLQNIVVNGVYSTQSVSGAYSQFTGYNATYPLNAYLANISLDATRQTNDAYGTIALDNVNITPTGTGITNTTWSTGGSVPSCTFQ